jgi:hypothetical protein
MRNMLINKSDLISVDFYIGTNDAGETVIVEKEEDSLKFKDVEKHFFKYKKLAYKDQVDILSKSVTSDGFSAKINFSRLGYEATKTLLAEWSFKEKKGEEEVAIPVTIEKLELLETTISNFIQAKILATCNLQ